MNEEQRQATLEALNELVHKLDIELTDVLAYDIRRVVSHLDSLGVLGRVPEGHAITRKNDKDIKELLTATKQKMCIGGHWVWAANLPYTMSSEAGHLLCMEAMYPMGSGELNEHPPFGATYYDVADGRIFSLRSVGDFDVSAIAKKYGGGGHKNAAGFKLQNGDTL